jgi:hypothetical protein
VRSTAQVLPRFSGQVSAAVESVYLLLPLSTGCQEAPLLAAVGQQVVQPVGIPAVGETLEDIGEVGQGGTLC